MTLTFLTNFINHHQISLADEYYKILGNSYTFVVYEPLPDRFVNSGYPEYDRPYLLKAYESPENICRVKNLISESDIVVVGQFPYSFVRQRIMEGKLTFCDDERWFKEYFKDCWMNFKFWFRPLYKFYQHTLYRNKNYYLLCASAYVAYDAHSVRAFPDKCYKWGYFTSVPELNIEAVINEKRNSDVIRILWVGRFIRWKHPELMIELAQYLIKKGYKFHINMYGIGKLYEDIVKKVRILNLSDVIMIGSSLPNSDILQQMRYHHIFCFTSDKNEGWGAVLNEAMSNGCCSVASNMIGAAPYLIKDQRNGLIYDNNHPITICEKVEWLINNPLERERMTIEAYYTMKNVWNAKCAANNFLLLANSLLTGNKNCNIEEGPCSKSPIIEEYEAKSSFTN